MHPLRDNRRVLAAAMVGTAVEFYDFFIYATAAALVFGPLFFPVESPAAQTLLALMSFSVAFVARPIGAIAFGHYGDRIGRKSTLVVSLMMMGGSTLAIAFLPTFHQAQAMWGAGWLAPALLCLCRFGQGFGLGGEWGGAALLSTENAPRGWIARFGAAPLIGVPVGLFAANATFLALEQVLGDAEMREWGWRIPFIGSVFLVGLGLWVRRKIGETPEFREAMEREPPVRLPLMELVSNHLGAMLAGSAGVIVVFAGFYLITVWSLAEATGPLGYPRQSVLIIQIAATICMTFGIIVSAWFADRSTPVRAMQLSAFGMALTGLVFGWGLTAGSLTMIAVTLCGTMIVMGMTYGPLAAWLVSLFPVRVRYSGVSFAFNVGGIMGGAFTPVLAQLLSGGGYGRWTGLLLTGAAALSLIGFRLARPIRDS